MDKFVATPVAEISRLVASARRTFDSGKTRSMEWRIRQINALISLVNDNQEALTAALQADMRRPQFDCVLTESMMIFAEANHTLSCIHEWVKPVSTRVAPALLPGSCWIQKEPLGVVCIIAPWNYPIMLAFNPIICAIAAGNCVVVKPSEVAPHCAALTAALITKYMDNDAIRCVNGGVAETTELLACRFDHILYTGNGAVGKVVMTAAAKHLTPVTLELGGKSPAIVARDADLRLAAQRLVWGKCLNAGQTCIAPDYVLVEENVADRFVALVASTLQEFYGNVPKSSPDLARIINSRHWDRVTGYLQDCGGEVVLGGDSDRKDLWLAPTVVVNPSLSSALMTEEIFGPILPIITVQSVDDAVAFVNQRPKPLALYVFSSSNATQNKVLHSTSSGGVTINDVIMHISNPELPFGGVGPSGMGAYHGATGFDTFSHHKAVFKPSSMVDLAQLRLPPYTPARLRTISLLLKHAPWLPEVGVKDVLLLGLSAVVVALACNRMQI